MAESQQKSAVLIAGATASGKSALALKIAKERHGVIINADSMQVYSELRILTARPTVEEENEVPHRLYGHISGADAYSVARWLAEASAMIRSCWAEGRLPIVCGGTGLYFMALERGLAEVPQFDLAIREKWRDFSGDIHAELQARDPEMAARLKPADRHRISRALEVIEGTGTSLAEWQRRGQQASVLADAEVERHFVEVDRAELYARAERRFEAMLEQGAVDEVQALPKFAAGQPITKVIGVPEIRAWLAGKLTRDEAVARAKTATRNYVKRQLTWWRGRGWQV